MEPSSKPVDPYAPPKSALTGNDSTTYLNEDGYVFRNQLVTNKHFQPPLICTKLGIPISPESEPQLKHITVKRILRIPQTLSHILTVIGSLAFICSLFYGKILPLVLIFIILNSLIRRLTSKPYKIPFYFSEQYKRIHKQRVITFSAIALIIIGFFITGIITETPQPIIFSILASIVTYLFFKFKMTKFVVTQTKGEFLYIRGAHPNLLNALPHLPLSS